MIQSMAFPLDGQYWSDHVIANMRTIITATTVREILFVNTLASIRFAVVEEIDPEASQAFQVGV